MAFGALAFASPAAALPPANQVSPAYPDVLGQLHAIKLDAPLRRQSKHYLTGTYDKSVFDSYSAGVHHPQGVTELSGFELGLQRRIAVSHSAKQRGFVAIGREGLDASASTKPAYVTLESSHPAGLQAAGGIIAVAQSDPVRLSFIDARNPDSPRLMKDSEYSDRVFPLRGTLNAAGLAYDRMTDSYWLLASGGGLHGTKRSQARLAPSMASGRSATATRAPWQADTSRGSVAAATTATTPAKAARSSSSTPTGA